MDQMDRLRELLEGADKEGLAQMLRQMNQADRPRRHKHQEHGPVKTYTEVVKEYECLVCGSITRKTIQLGKGEQISTIDPVGHTHTITATGKEGSVKIACIVSRCDYCERVISQMTREELERSFLTLVSCMSWQEKREYRTRMNRREAEEKEVIRI
jgi:hypothetical protein